jgi:hypothetical protein
MRKLATLLAASLIAASPLAFADDAATTNAGNEGVSQSSQEKTLQVADAGTDATAAAPTKEVAKKKHHAKKHVKHHKKAAKPVDAAPADAATPAAAQ